jgi:hypothetical protein
VLAYRGTAASPTFISAIHMNVEAGSTNAAWDGAVVSGNASALPTGLTSGVNCIWIGLPGDFTSEHNNAKYGLCSLPAINGSLVALRAALNNQANWTVDDNTPPLFTLPTACNYLASACSAITVTNPAITSGFANAPFSQTFTASGGDAPYTFTTASALPAGITLSAAGVLSGTPTVTGTFPIVVTATDASGCTGTSATYTLVINPNLCTGAQVVQLGSPAFIYQSNTIAGFTIPAGTNRLLVVTASDAAAITITGVTFGGTPMIKQAELSDGFFAVDAIFTLALGSSGSSSSGNIVVTSASGDKFITATVFQFVNQATPVSSPVSLQNPGPTPPLFNTLTVTSAANDLAFDLFDYFKNATGPNTATFGGGQTSIVSQGPLTITALGFGYWSTSWKNGAAPNVTMTRTTTSNNAWIHVGLNIKAGATVISVTNPVVTSGLVNTPFSQTFTASGGTAPYTFTTFSALPAGLTLSPGGVLSGTPTVTGTFPIVVSATIW